MNRVAIILQARTGSTRLPNKILMPLGGTPLLAHCIRRLNKVTQVIVATSDLPNDDAVEILARKEGAECFRGAEDDVLDRYFQAAKKFNLDYIVRATGDNPFVDPEEARRVERRIADGMADYVTGIDIINGRGLPVGIGVEAFTFESLSRSWREGHEQRHREHVNDYILDNPGLFSIIRLECLKKNSCPGLRLTVDTEDDFRFAVEIVKSFNKPAVEISTQEIIDWWERRKG